MLTIQVVFDTFTEVCGSEDSWTGKSIVREISARSGLAKTTIQMYMRTLESLGVISRTGPKVRDNPKSAFSDGTWRLLKRNAVIVKRDGYYQLQDTR